MMEADDQAVPRQVAVAALRNIGVAQMLQAENGRDAIAQILDAVTLPRASATSVCRAWTRRVQSQGARRISARPSCSRALWKRRYCRRSRGWRARKPVTPQEVCEILACHKSRAMHSLTAPRWCRASCNAVRWHRCGHRWSVSANLSLPFLESDGVAHRIAGLADRHAIEPQRTSSWRSPRALRLPGSRRCSATSCACA
jgi:hypothetical protein